ncbi:EF hand domain-containing protein [Zymomonas mobilis]|uniref:EF hand domain-containing protein n=1 Tax=Zymomonas mobilis TaxID=542 RepID=A0A542W1G9_ZYMMB|nr:EF-hand domain-containing protein [Zymomonas mobilis]TQL17431.1 EF hand domain-containing protein [Zymomonas mobilis]
MKKKNFLLSGLSLASGLFLATTPLTQALAQDVPPHILPITRVETQARVKQDFEKFDLDHNGVVTKAEFQTVLANEKNQCQAMMEKFKNKKAGDHKGHTPPPASADGTPPPEDGKGGHPHGHHHMCDMDKGPVSHWFDRADTNHDGQVTYDEASSEILGAYDAVDTNHDGVISPDERKAAFEKWKAAHPFPKPSSK